MSDLPDARRAPLLELWRYYLDGLLPEIGIIEALEGATDLLVAGVLSGRTGLTPGVIAEILNIRATVEFPAEPTAGNPVAWAFSFQAAGTTEGWVAFNGRICPDLTDDIDVAMAPPAQRYVDLLRLRSRSHVVFDVRFPQSPSNHLRMALREWEMACRHSLKPDQEI